MRSPPLLDCDDDILAGVENSMLDRELMQGCDREVGEARSRTGLAQVPSLQNSSGLGLKGAICRLLLLIKHNNDNQV
jgi:hypothetical protein